MTSTYSGNLPSTGDPFEEPRLTENARKVLEARYLKKDEAGHCTETPGALFNRVAQTVAEVETQYGATETERQHWQERFYRLMTTGAFMPNSPTLMNAGREMGMLSACFVLPVKDSIVDIFDSIKHTAMIQKSGGGTGFAFDELRPTGDFIKSSGGTTSGPISFWRAFSEATNAIQQGAFRRGANMGMMYIHHPDILKFLHAKQDLNQFTNYNISVKITDDWMNEFERDADTPHIVRNPRNGKAFVIPRDVEIWKYDMRHLVEVDCVIPVAANAPERYFRSPVMNGDLPAELRGKVYTKRDIWNIIIQNAWQTGEPGVVFIDRINESNPTPHVGRIEATNPCGEQPLLPYEACNLGSVNLGLFIKNPCTPQAAVDWPALREAVRLSVRFLDNVIDANNYPLPEIDRICKANRKIGLGIMGFADALYKLNVAYNSDAGVEWGEKFMKFTNDEAHIYSEYLARSRGCFPNWKGSIWHTRHNRLMRNAAVTTVAPTGTISIIANCSGGIEPMFSLAFIRNVLRGQKQGEKPLVEVNDTFLQVAKARGFHSDALLERIAREGTLAHIEGIPEDVKHVFVCAHDIAPEWHMKMQAGFQRHCDSSISKTINFPHAATVEDVEKIYRLAFELRCKGVTVYRDGCRSFQPMALKKDEKAETKKAESKPADAPANPSAAQPEDSAARQPAETRPAASADNLLPAAAARRIEPRLPVTDVKPAEVPPVIAVRPVPPTPASLPLDPADLPEIVSGLRIRQMTPFGNMHVKITVDPRNERELEIFAQLGKGGDVANSDLEGMCRVASLWLRAGGSLKHLLKQWEGIGSSLQIPTRAGRIMSLPDGLACALRKYIRVKERFGLRAMLLGEIDLNELYSPAPGVEVHDRPVVAGETRANGPANGGSGSGPAHGGGTGPVFGGAGNGSAGHAPGLSGGHGTAGGARHATAAEHPAAERGGGRTPRPAATGFSPAASVKSGAAVLDPALAAKSPVAVLDPAARFEAVTAIETVETIETITAVDTLESVEVTLSESLDLLARDDSAVGPDLIEAVVTTATLLHAHDAAQFYKLHCPQCDGTLAMQEGCKKCHECGWTAC
jgi:ribonucleoside-diphosphate reductase alpha chain